MTKWIQRYQQQAEERYQRLDALLDRMQGRDDTHGTTDDTTGQTADRQRGAAG
ncbi:hypothetical protein [Nocardioides sp. J9]|nr:hypothetical protein [Nocardioides sp. J9]